MKNAFDQETSLFLRKTGAIMRLVLNRGAKRNALTQDMWLRITDLLAVAAADLSMRVLIIESAAAGVFTAGADIKEFELLAKNAALREPNRAAMVGAQHALAHFPHPTIAMINGVARGAGVGLAVAADFRFASADSSFAITPAKLGLVYPLEDTKRLITLVGLQAVKRMIFTAQVLDSAAALAMGLVDHVGEAATLEDDVADFAAQLVAHSSHTIRGMKQMMQRVAGGQMLDDEESINAFVEAYAGDDFAEGVAAFLEKRAPKFT